ncbi:site-specific integrase [Acidobacteriia bacterium AH_259_A11_L15]|nr:site-specific integrase [Acidobacteriia bacterium AH_259_A11_L15]
MKQRGIYEKVPGSGAWWIRYADATGRIRREKAGTKSAAIELYHKRKTEALQGKKLPERLRRAPISFREIAQDALAYSEAHKLSHASDRIRMAKPLNWFGEKFADAINAQDIERYFEGEDWSPATWNRYRALLSLTYRLGIRNGKVKENPARLVAHRAENNGRVRFLSREEEMELRKAICENFPERLSEFELALHTGLRLGEHYAARWDDVDLERRILTVPRSKNGETRHVPLNAAAIRALAELRKRTWDSGFVCGGVQSPRRWFEPALKTAAIRDFTWHCLRHTFASRLVMSGTDLRTVAELLGHKTLAMVMRYAHLAPDYQLAAVERMASFFSEGTDTRTSTRPVERYSPATNLVQ